MKKILTFIAAVMMFFSISAQPTPGFWSNWSVGGNVTVSEQMKFDNIMLGQDFNWGLGLRASKQLSDRWAFRGIVEYPGIFTSDTNAYDRYTQILVGFQYGKNFYGFIDGGAAIGNDEFGWVALNADAGIGYRWIECEHNIIYTELGIDVTADVRRSLSTSHLFIRLGYAYNFGLTKKDKAIFEQYELAQIDSYEYMKRMDSISHEHEKCSPREKELLEKIANLENQQKEVVVLKEMDNTHAKELDSIINDIKANQDIMYALPFSIEFPLNSYDIPKDQKYRLKEIAKIMSQDTTVSFTVAGYCDASGSDEYNQTLSEKRAQSVADALIKLGVKEDQLTVTGKGKKIAFGDLDSKINRRVSFFKNID